MHTPLTATQATVDMDQMTAQALQNARQNYKPPGAKSGLIRSAFSTLYNYKYTLTFIAAAAFIASPYGAQYRPMLTKMFWDIVTPLYERINPPPPPPPPPKGWFG